MRQARHRSPGGLARRCGLLLALLVPALAGGDPAAAAPPPAIVLSPGSGTPGSFVAISGTGFCGSTGCSRVSVLFAGIPVAEGLAVARDGTFAGRFRVPGGGVVGVQNVTATQTRADGYEIRAFAQYDLVFGIGEEAEVQAQINDLAALRSGAPLPEPPLRGIPLESAVARDRAAAAGAGSTAETVATRRTAAQSARRAAPYAAAGAALLGGLALLALRRRARRRPRHAHL